MERFNFNIHNYSISEMQSFFKLNNITDYTSNNLLIELNSKEQIIKDKIYNSELSQDTKLKIYNFLENAKNILL